MGKYFFKFKVREIWRLIIVTQETKIFKWMICLMKAVAEEATVLIRKTQPWGGSSGFAH